MGNRVLHVAAVDFTTAKLLSPQLRDLTRRGYDVRVAVGRTDDAYWSQIQEFRPKDIHFPRSVRPIAMLGATLRLLAFAWTWRPDILHLHTPAASAPVRAVPRWLWPPGMKMFYTVHGYLHMWPPRGRMETFAQRLEERLSRKTDTCLFQSKEDLEEAVNRGYGSSLEMLGNGVGDEWFEAVDVPRKVAGAVTMVFVGRLVQEKGILDLLDAVGRTPGVVLHVVGDALPSDRDAVADEVRSRASARDLAGRVHLHGMLPASEVRKVYELAHVFALPSYREGVPRSVIEAMAQGRPVLSTSIRGCRELVEEGGNGVLVDPGDVVALGRALEQFRDMSAIELNAMSDRSRSLADPDLRESKVFERLNRSYVVSQ